LKSNETIIKDIIRTIENKRTYHTFYVYDNDSYMFYSLPLNFGLNSNIFISFYQCLVTNKIRVSIILRYKEKRDNKKYKIEKSKNYDDIKINYKNEYECELFLKTHLQDLFTQIV